MITGQRLGITSKLDITVSLLRIYVVHFIVQQLTDFFQIEAIDRISAEVKKETSKIELEHMLKRRPTRTAWI